MLLCAGCADGMSHRPKWRVGMRYSPLSVISWNTEQVNYMEMWTDCAGKPLV